MTQFRDIIEIHLEIIYTEAKRRAELERLVEERTASLQGAMAQQIEAINRAFSEMGRRKKTEESLRKAQDDLARISRITFLRYFWTNVNRRCFERKGATTGLVPHRPDRRSQYFLPGGGPESTSILLLLHGFPSSSRMFQPLLQSRLSNICRLIAPDYPGFGHSSWRDPKVFNNRLITSLT